MRGNGLVSPLRRSRAVPWGRKLSSDSVSENVFPSPAAVRSSKLEAVSGSDFMHMYVKKINFDIADGSAKTSTGVANNMSESG